MTTLKLYWMGALDKIGLAEIFLSNATYAGLRKRTPDATERYRRNAVEAAEKIRRRQAAAQMKRSA